MPNTTNPTLVGLAEKVEALSVTQKLQLAIGLLDHGRLDIAETVIDKAHLELIAARLLGRSPKL